MSTWNSRGLRGSTLEELVHRTIARYREEGLALIQKIPTPITPVQMSPDHSQITLAYFEQRSTVDYIGAVQGIPVCFDAKECHTTTFPLANVHEHQVEFMREMEQQDGIAFFLICFTATDEYYYLTFRDFLYFYDRMASGGRKSFRKNELDPGYYISCKGDRLMFLEQLQKDLSERQQNK